MLPQSGDQNPNNQAPQNVQATQNVQPSQAQPPQATQVSQDQVPQTQVPQAQVPQAQPSVSTNGQSSIPTNATEDIPKDRLRVFVQRNKEGAPPGSFVTVKNDVSFAKFKKACGRELKMRAKRIFQSTGVEVKFMDEVRQGDHLFISQGAAFYKTAVSQTPGAMEEFSFAVLGKGGVGKSAITLRFIRDFFVKFWDPTVEDAYTKVIAVDGKVCKVKVLDTAGQDTFESLRVQWMSDRDGYVFVYDMTDAESVKSLIPYFELKEQLNTSVDVPIIMVANKKDLVESTPSACQIPTARGMAYASQWGADTYIETSALTGENVLDVFENLIRILRKYRKPPRIPTQFRCEII